MRKVVLVALCGVLLGAASPALAGTPSQGAYGGTGNSQLSQVQSVTSSKSSASGTLPFTGLNVGVLAGVAMLMIGGGVFLRLRTRPDRA